VDPVRARLGSAGAHLETAREVATFVAMFGLALIVVIATAGSGGSAVSASEPEESPGPLLAPDNATVAQDARVRAFADAYAPFIDSVTYRDDDVVFHLGETPVHFLDGRMVAEDRLDTGDSCDPVFYRY